MLSCLGIVGTVFQQQQTVAFPYYEKKKKVGWGAKERKEKENKNCQLFRECHLPTRRQNDFVFFFFNFLPLRVTLYITLVLPS